MEILVSQVRKGDYVENLGVITDVRNFYRDRAVKSKLSPLANQRREDYSDKTVYARLVAKQQEDSYESVLDCVVLFSDANKRTFAADKTVKVYRFLKEAV